MAATIKIKNSSTASAVPTSSDLVQGELAVNVTDKRIFTENASGTVVELGTNPSILTLPDGSASAPTLTNDGDTNTGIFFPAADTVGISTGGSERARVDSSGNMGLGTTSPSTRLHAKGASGTTTLRLEPSSSTTIYTQVRGVNGDLYLEADAGNAEGSSAMIFTVDGSESARINASGNLGVGTSSPSFKLEVTALKDNVKINASQAGQMLAMVQSSANPVIMRMTNNSSNFWDTQVNTDNSISWDYNDTERARIDSSGNLLVGTTTAGGIGNSLYKFSGGTYTVSNTSSTTLNHHIFQYNSSTVGTISTTTTATSYVTSSDYRLKNSVTPMTGALAKVASLKPVTYKWNVDSSDGEGFIAHELAEVCPQAVVGEKDAVDAEGNPKYQGIDTSFLVATLTAAIQELNAKFEAYKASHP